MKKYIFISIIFLSFTSQISSQNYFPLEVGNRWQYLSIEYGGIFTIPDTNYYNASLFYNEVLEDTLINNNLYYNFSQNPDNLFRFLESDQKIFYRWENEDKLIMDFQLPTDSFFISYLLSPDNQEVGANVISGNYWLFDTLFSCKGYRWSLTVDGALGQIVKYIPNYGIVADSFYYYDNASLSYEVRILKLLQANISGNDYRGNELPEIIVDPITSLTDSSFNIPITVKHSNNIIFPISSSFDGFNYIDSVNLHSFYSKDDSLVYNQSVAVVNEEGTEIWNINTVLNMQLLKDDFEFNYRIEAIDKGMFPHHSFSPDTGHYKAVWDTISSVKTLSYIVNSFSLSQNFPNPFNPLTTIIYLLPELSLVTLKVYDVLGNEIAILVNEELPAGEYEVEFNGTGIPSGIYFYQLNAGSFVAAKKMLMIK